MSARGEAGCVEEFISAKARHPGGRPTEQAGQAPGRRCGRAEAGLVAAVKPPRKPKGDPMERLEHFRRRYLTGKKPKIDRKSVV